MPVFPNKLHSLFPSANGKAKDLEKNDEHHGSTPQEGKRDIYIHHPRQRSTELDLHSAQLDVAEDPKTAEPTRTYRILPIFSGIMVPFSIMLSIPSLTSRWYIRTGDNGVLLETRPNPPLLNAAMALSMGCGILASACLVIRFAERQIKLMTFLCIVFLTLHDLINIPTVTIFGVEHRFDDGFTYGQAFWFTVCSTVASTVTNITLLTDYTQTKNFIHSGSGLTHKQRSLVIIVIILLCYVSVGSILLAEMLKMSFIDALYLSVVSIETIGFGDLHPNSTATRIFACFYIAGGILNLALAVALSREALLESAAVGFRTRIRAAEARQRERHIRTRWKAAVRWRLRAEGQPMWVDDHDEERRGRVGKRRHHHWYSSIRRIWRKLWDEVWREWEDPAWKYVYGSNHKRLNLEALTEAQLETAALEAGAPLAELIPKGYKLRKTRRNDTRDHDGAPPNTFFPRVDSISSVNGAPLTYVRLGGMISLLAKFAIAMAHPLDNEPEGLGRIVDEPEPIDNPNASGDLLEETPHLPSTGRTGIPFTRTMTMTTIAEEETSLAESLEKEEKNAFRARLTVALSLFFVFWTAGSAIFMKTEGWSFGSAAYFCFVSFTTVGYGDFAPKTPAGRSIFVVWAMLGVGTMTILISILAEAYSTQYKSIIKSEVLKSTGSTTAIDTARPYDSRTMLNTASDPDPYRPTFSPPSTWNSTPIPIPPNTLRLGRGPILQHMSSIPELQLKIGPNPQQRVSKERLQALPQQVLDHAQAVRSLLAAISIDETAGNSQSDLPRTDRTMEALMFEIERSLQGVTSAAREIINVPPDITKH